MKTIYEQLVEAGWREYPDGCRKYARCFFRAFDTPTRCKCNHEKPGIQVELSIGGLSQSMEVELVGELPDGTWIKILNYGLQKSLDEVTALIPRLLATWEAANKDHETKANTTEAN